MGKLPHDQEHYRELINDLRDEEDLCRNECVDDLADLLDRAATAIEGLAMVLEHCDENNA